MKKIFGIRFVESKDLEAMRGNLEKELKENLDRQLAEGVLANKEQMHRAIEGSSSRTARALDFIMRRMPMKRHRKQLREHMDNQ